MVLFWFSVVLTTSETIQQMWTVTFDGSFIIKNWAAFDRIYPIILMDKLKALNIPHFLLHWIWISPPTKLNESGSRKPCLMSYKYGEQCPKVPSSGYSRSS